MTLWRRKRVHDEALKAQERARLALENAKKKRVEADQIAESLRELRRNNRFAERIEILIRGGRP